MDLNPSKKEIKKSEVFTLKFKSEVMMSEMGMMTMGGVFLLQITPKKTVTAILRSGFLTFPHY